MKMKRKTFFEINICSNGKLQRVKCENRKQVNEWLFNYFVNGEESVWIRLQYEQENSRLSFERFVRKFIRNDRRMSQTFHIRKGKLIFICEKENK